MNAITPLFLLTALVAVPIGLRLAAVPDGPRRRPHTLARMTALPAAALLLPALGLLPGTAATLLAVPWLAMGSLAAFGGLLRLANETNGGRRLPGPNPRLALDAAAVFLLVGCAFVMVDRAGLEPLGIGQPIVRLTAIHFTVGGFVLVVVGATTWQHVRARWVGVAVASVVAGMPLAALGFVGVSVVGVAGALLVAAGGLGVGAAQLVAGRRLDSRAARLLVGVAGVALVGSMPLAAAYALADAFGLAGPSLELMAAVHGTLNVLGFALPATIGWRAATIGTRSAAPELPDGRMALVAAGIALAFGALLTAFMAAERVEPSNALIPRWLVIGPLFALPGTIGLIGALRERRAVIVAAGLLCFGQAFLAFSLVTIPFLIPAVVLLSVGLAGTSPNVRGGAVGFGIVALGIAGWAGALGITQEICWESANGAGCSSGQITAAGGALAAGAWLAAVALAVLAPGTASVDGRGDRRLRTLPGVKQ